MGIPPPLLLIEDLGLQICRLPLARKADLARHKEPEVENPVIRIIDELGQSLAAQEISSLRDGIVLEQHINRLTEVLGQRLRVYIHGV